MVRWASVALEKGNSAEALRALIRDRFGTRHVFLTSTGRAGLTLILRAMRRLASPNRDEVIVPSYTCYSVAASVVKAGLRPRLVDISPSTLDYRSEKLAAADSSRVLAIVATNLYGIPNDLAALSRWARERDVFLVDDASQAMGALHGERPSGTWGDAGLFSFDKGKNVAAIEGGAILTGSDDVATQLAGDIETLPSPAWQMSARHVAKAIAYALFLRPRLYWVPAAISQLGLGQTVFSTEFSLEAPCGSFSSLALIMMRHLDEFTGARVANAARLVQGLRPFAEVRPVVAGSGSGAVYLRLPILFETREVRNAALAALSAARCGASTSYPESLADVPELRPLIDPETEASGGREVAARIVTLPTHPLVQPADVTQAVDVIESVMRAATGARCNTSRTPPTVEPIR